MEKPTYTFGHGTAEGDATLINLLGGKGANLAEMCKAGLPVPEGLTISTDTCMEYLNADAIDKASILDDLMDNHVVPLLRNIKKTKGYLPLLSIRSGARKSMPGMMDTILNVGLTPKTLDFWVDRLGLSVTQDCYRRLVHMYGYIVHDIDNIEFTNILDNVIAMGSTTDEISDLSTVAMKTLISKYKQLYLSKTGLDFPINSKHQVRGAIEAVFNSWNSNRAKHYRKMHGYPDNWGTAVTIQCMVFGNAGNDSCSGVLFTRDPSTGESKITGEYLVNAQGEDVVAGTTTPLPLSHMQEWNPAVSSQLTKIAMDMELHYRDMQDMEFTVENGKLYILQTRCGKRSPRAAFVIANDLYTDGMIDLDEVKDRITYRGYLDLEGFSIDKLFTGLPNGKGIPAAGGVVSGLAVYTTEEAIACDEDCILVTKETTPDDIAGIDASIGILTQTGGATSHAAVVARGLGKTCVVGVTDLDYTDDFWSLGDSIIYKDTIISIDGSTGNVWVGLKVPVVKNEIPKEAENLVSVLLKSVGGSYTPLMSWNGLKEIDNLEMVYIDTLGLNTDKDMKILLQGLHNHVGTVVLNVEPQIITNSLEDEDLWNLFTTKNDVSDYYNRVALIVKLLDKHAPDDLYDRLQIHTPQAEQDVINLLKATKIYKLHDVSDIKAFLDLVKSKDTLGIVTPFMHKQVGGSENMSVLADAYPLEATLIPLPTSRSRLLYEVLSATKETN